MRSCNVSATSDKVALKKGRGGLLLAEGQPAPWRERGRRARGCLQLPRTIGLLRFQGGSSTSL